MSDEWSRLHAWIDNHGALVSWASSSKEGIATVFGAAADGATALVEVQIDAEWPPDRREALRVVFRRLAGDGIVAWVDTLIDAAPRPGATRGPSERYFLPP